jgi:hypothetical protein
MFSNSKKDWIIYFIYGSILLLYIFISNKLLIELDNIAKSTYNITPVMVVSIFLFIIFGMLLGASCLFKEVKKQGVWKINVGKLVFLAIPSLYVVLSLFILWFKIDWLSFLISKQLMIYIMNSSIIGSTLEILLGYALISSLYKTST